MKTPDFNSLTIGRIMRAWVPDKNGTNPKSRPVVIFQGPQLDERGELFYQVACGSTQPPENEIIEKFTVRLDGSSPHGHPRTGLLEETWFYADWLEKVYESQFVHLFKFMREHQLMALIEMITMISEPDSDS